MKLNKLYVCLVAFLMLLFFETHSPGQNNYRPDKTIENLRAFRNHSATQSKSLAEQGGKCGLWLNFELMNQWNNYSNIQKQELQKLLAPTTRQINRVIGHFRFYYDTTGVDAASMIDSNYNLVAGTAEQYVDSAGVYFNYAWTYEIDTLGYTLPPLDIDGTYHVVIYDLDPGLYGQTLWNPSSPLNGGTPVRYATYIEIDNNFYDLPRIASRGIPAIKVTAAHEFHHAIQIGSYGLWGKDIYFYEITSTWMEDVVYDDVNDYHQYLFNVPNSVQTSQFAEPKLRFTSQDRLIQYSRAIWAKYLENKFSRSIVKRTWEYMKQESSLPALDDAIREYSGQTKSFRDAFLEWSYWNANTGPTADSTQYYRTEGTKYPVMNFRPIVTFTPPSRAINDSIQVLSSSYHPIVVNGNTMLSIISNLNISTPYDNSYHNFSYVLNQNGGDKKLANDIFVTINASDPQNWASLENVPVQISSILAFPNPLIAKNNKPLKFRLPFTAQSSGMISVFSSSMKGIFSNELPIISNQITLEQVMTWDAHDNVGNMLSTGVYFYVITLDDKQYKGKFAVVRE